MGRIGNTAKKLQTVADTAEKVYIRIEELRTEVNALREGVQATRETTERIEQELAGQRAVLRALAAEQGVDADALVEEVMAEPTTGTDDATGNGDTSTGGTTAETTDGATTEPVEDATSDTSTDAEPTDAGPDGTTGTSS